jgi:hypothetical protein
MPVQGLKLKDANLTNAALEAEVQRREAQEGTLRSQLLAKDFDLTHTRALKHMLDNRVADLERVIKAHHDLVSGGVVLALVAGVLGG